MLAVKKKGIFMSSTSPSFPVIKQINEFRQHCWEINYEDPENEVPLENSIAAWIGHKVFSVISIPANTAGFAIGSIGTLGSCCLATIKISVWFFSDNKNAFPTGFNYFSRLAGKSFLQFSEIIYENLFEYGYRMSSVFDKVIYPGGNATPPLPWNALPFINELNEKRLNLYEGERTIGNWFTHKLISIINIPLNFAATVVTGVGTGISLTFLICKVALYILTGIKIRTSSGFEYLAKATLMSGAHFILNIVENGKDSLLLVGDIAKLLGTRGAIGRVRDFATHAFQRFSEALHGEIHPTEV
jgi:hypothetical protein